MKSIVSVPWWVVALIIGLSAIEPLTHLWLGVIDGDDRVTSGLHTADSAIYLHSMRMFDTGFHSPYATCQSAVGDKDPSLYPATFHWVYGIIGAVGRILHINEFLFLGIANALCGAIYLLVVYHLLTVIAAQQARLAFLLFTCAGGLGGALYALSAMLGLHDSAQFDTYFLRFSMYELVEGPYLSPILHIPRLYYTLSLALCYGALSTYITATRIRCNKHLAFSAFLLFLGALVNMRFGGLLWGVAALHVLTRPVTNRPWLSLFALLAAAVSGAAVSVYFMTSSDTFIENTAVLVREGLWITAFISVSFFHLLIVGPFLIRSIRTMSAVPRVLNCGLGGYLAAFTFLFIAHQLYYGTGFISGDTAAAIRISDWAIPGAFVGLLLGRRIDGTRSSDEGDSAWFSLWLLSFLALALSAFGQGWFLRLNPQRLLVFMGIPLAILATMALQHIARSRPAHAKVYTATLMAAGISSIIVGALFFQGPLMRAPGQGPFAHLHPEIISDADRQLIDTIARGVVLAPHRISDAIALRPGLQVLSGAGLTDLSDQRSTALEPQVSAFFARTASAEDRRDFLERWCVDYILCPDTWPVTTESVAQLENDPGLRIVARKGTARLFEVLSR